MREEKSEDGLERKIRIVEDTLKGIQEEKRENDRKLSEWKARRKKLMEEGKMKMEEQERKVREKEIRLQKKTSLEEKWELLRWTTRFIDEHKDGWEKERIDREKYRARETTATWSEKTIN